MIKHLLISFGAVLVFSCKSATPNTGGIAETTETSASPLPYFKATGNEPFWGLTIAETAIQLHLAGEEKTLSFKHTDPEKAMDANVKRYRLENTDGKLEITIIHSECVNDMSGDTLAYSVTLQLEREAGKTETYRGCGRYWLPPRFHDIWALETLNGKRVTAADFAKELPYLEINHYTNQYIGYGGCNRISGQLFYEPGVLRVTKGISTLMACGGTNKEKEFLAALSNVTQYEFKERYLWLSNPSGVLVILKKVD